MACIINIETSTQACSLAVSVDGKIVFNRMEKKPSSHASLIGVFGQAALDYIHKNKWKAEAVAISAGPGSYTGLRIGVSYAKGLCFGLDIPLIAVPTLKIMSLSALEKRNDLQLLYCPMIDARRMEVYSAIYDVDLNEIRGVQAEIIDENSYQEYLKEKKIVFFGNGADKCKDILCSPNAFFLDDIIPEAEKMISLAEKAYQANEFVDVAYFEPYYLKEFQATVAKNKVLKTNR